VRHLENLVLKKAVMTVDFLMVHPSKDDDFQVKKYEKSHDHQMLDGYY
jgi:hypothetical protein